MLVTVISNKKEERERGRERDREVRETRKKIQRKKEILLKCCF
jgi:hypothetical protein